MIPDITMEGLHNLPRRVCRCGHLKDVHLHFRDGKDCARCDCPRYRRRWIR
jgi:hypothetical protein